MITPKDLRSMKLASGYHHVHSASAGPNGGGKTKLWKARHKGERVGPFRRQSELAAQDYCDYVNSGNVVTPAVLARVKRKKPQALRRSMTEREKSARVVVREEVVKNPIPKLHEPVCYLIGVKMDMLAVKIGHADYNVHSRLDSLQTGNPRELVLLGTLPGGKSTEDSLHAKYVKDNRLGEWFTPTASLLREFKLTVRDYKARVR